MEPRETLQHTYQEPDTEIHCSIICNCKTMYVSVNRRMDKWGNVRPWKGVGHVYTHRHGKISQCIMVGGNDSLQNEPHGTKRTICLAFKRHTHNHATVHGHSWASTEVDWKGAAEVQLHIIVGLALFRHSSAFYHCKREPPKRPPRACRC